MGRRPAKSDGPEYLTDDSLEGLVREILGPEDNPDVNYFLSTGVTLVDCAIDELGRGLPGGRIIEIYGDEATGKTFLALSIIRQAQLLGGRGLFQDAEARLSKNFAVSKMKLKLEKAQGWHYGIPDNLEVALKAMEQVCLAKAQDPLPTVAVIDSIAALTAGSRSIDQAEVGEAKQPGTDAKAMSEFFRRGLIRKIKGTNVYPIFINQTRATFGISWGTPEPATPGGKALKFYSSTRLVVSQKKIEKVPPTTAMQVNIYVKKTGLGPPFRTVSFPLVFSRGLDDDLANVNYLAATNVLSRKGSLLEYEGSRHYKKDWVRMAREDPELSQRLRKLVRERYRENPVADIV